MTIEARGLVKTFADPERPGGRFVAVDGVDFAIGDGELVALLGPSGGGKSTVLRLIAGLEQPDAGSISLDGVRVDDLHARERNVGFVFQSYALFKRMSVIENVAFGLRARGTPRAAARAKAEALLAKVGLSGFGERRPDELSGGQRQRVALARALAPDPRVLLLDEPFSAVDARVREDLRRFMRAFHDENGVTTIFVTHDQDEAFQLADRVLVFQSGRVVQHGTPAEVIDRPQTELVARFLADGNVVSAIVTGGRARIGEIEADAPGRKDGDRVSVFVRSGDVSLRGSERGSGVIRRAVLLGDRIRFEVMVDGGPSLVVHAPRRDAAAALATGDRVALSAPTSALRVYDDAPGASVGYAASDAL